MYFFYFLSFLFTSPKYATILKIQGFCVTTFSSSISAIQHFYFYHGIFLSKLYISSTIKTQMNLVLLLFFGQTCLGQIGLSGRNKTRFSTLCNVCSKRLISIKCLAIVAATVSVYSTQDTYKTLISLQNMDTGTKERNSLGLLTISLYVQYGSTGCGVFKRGIQNQKDFCKKINIPKGNY